MLENRSLAERFQAQRPHLHAVAQRLLGSTGEAEDAVQEAWLRLSRSDAGAVDNLGGWMTTVVARVCLDMLRARTSRREEALSVDEGEPLDDVPGADAELQLADSLGVALSVVLETLAPAERVAFVLHDLFDLPFEEIAAIVGRSPAAARQLASRGRRRVQGASRVSDVEFTRQRHVVEAFLAASRGGDLGGLLALLDPAVVLRADDVAVQAAAAAAAHGAPALASRLEGAHGVADAFKGRAQASRPALVDGAVGAAWAPGGSPRVVFAFTVEQGKITAIEVFMDPARLGRLDVALLDT